MTVPDGMIFSRGSSDLHSIPNLAWAVIISSPIHAALRSVLHLGRELRKISGWLSEAVPIQ